MAKTAKKSATKSPKTATKKAAPKAAKPAPKKAAAKKAAPKKAAAKKAAPKKAGGTSLGLMAPVTPSPALADVIGNKALPRTEITKKIWEYIKKNNLQDQQNRRMINADDKLRVIFDGKSQISMFELAKVVNKNVK